MPDSQQRQARSREDLEAELVEQVDLLRRHIAAFDEGIESAGKLIANSLRLLLHTSRRNSRTRGLLDQLDRLAFPFLDACGEIDPRNLLPQCTLTSFLFDHAGVKIQPYGIYEPPERRARWIDFDTWWRTSLVYDHEGHSMSREQLALNVAETDGGTHVDSGITPAYASVLQKPTLSWTVEVNGQPDDMAGRLSMACMAQIGGELIRSLDRSGRLAGRQVTPAAPS